MITIDGLVSGIDTQAILDGLLQIQKQRLDRLTLQKQEILTKQAAFQGIEASVVSFRSAISRLVRSRGSVFSQSEITSSDDSIVTATSKGEVAPGVFHVSVESIARAHQVASQSLSTADSLVTQGTLEIRSGNGPVATITIDDSNDTLQGVTDSINSADVGVSAAIIQDGTGYRILLTADETGTDHELQITNNLAADNGGATQVQFDLNSPVQEAANSIVQLGQGAGAIQAVSQDTQLDGLIPNLSLDLLKAAPGEVVTIQIRPDTEASKTAINDFVDAYNSLIESIAQQTRYVAETDQAGVLLGENAVLDIQNRIQSALQEAVGGIDGKLNRLTAIGISFNDDGTLLVDSGRLDDVLAGRVEGVTSKDVQRLFALTGESTNSGVSFLLGSSRTLPSSVPYEVDISRAAERAELTGATPLAVSTVIDGTNDNAVLTVDSQQIEINLEHGTYSQGELVDLVASTINAQPDLLGRRVTGILNGGGTLSLRSDSYGQSSELTFESGTLLSTIGFSGGETDKGVDVAGRFLVNGVAEDASGSGRVLTGLSGNDHTADLQLLVSLSAGDITPDSEADLTVTQGIGSRLDSLLGKLLDVDNGQLGIVKRGFDARAESIQTTIDRQNETFDLQRDRLLRELISLESAISQIQNTSSLLGAQLASLPNPSRN
ncbi:MAG: flagellar filament capping protein FliD [Planctomycetaceae bacterium]